MGVCYPGGSRRGGGYPGVAPEAAASVPFQNVGSTEQVFVFSRALRAPVCVPECWIDCVPALPHLRVPIRECSDGTWIALVSVFVSFRILVLSANDFYLVIPTFRVL